jgi:hypothetical protein
MAFTPPAVDEIDEQQPKFTPPAPEAIDVEANIKLTDYDRYKSAVAHGAAPENYSELGLPPSQNPDWDLVRAGGYAGLPLSIMGKAAGKVGEAVGDVAVKVADIPTRLANAAKGTSDPENPFHRDTLEERTAGGQNIITFPDAPSMKGQGIIPEVSEGISNLASHTATALLGRPQSALTLPLLGGEGAVGKLAALTFGVSTAAGIPDEVVNAVKVASDPNATTAQKVEAAGNPLVQAVLAKSMMEHAAAPKATPTARPESQFTTEHSKLLDPHLTEDGHVMTQLEDGQVMRANHESGQIEVDPQQFAKWVDNDLKDLPEKDRAAAVKSAFEHEDIHLKTDASDAEPFWNSLSPLEQYVLKRQYLKGQDASKFTPAQLGFEAIRNRVERAMGMDRSDFVGLALHERWTAQALDHLSHIVGKIRGLRDSELSAHQKSILDKVTDNISAARQAVGGVAPADQPFMLRKEDEPTEGMTRLYRGHEGDRGGAYWTENQDYAKRMGSQTESVDVPSHLLPDYSVRKVEGSGTPGTYKLPQDLTKYSRDLEPSAVPTHDLGPAMLRKAEDDLESPLPKLADGERVVLVKRPDGTIYRAAYSGKQYDVSAGGQVMIDKYGSAKVDSIGIVNERGAWTHGLLPKGDKIIKGFSPYAAVERSGEPEGPAMLRKKGKAGEQEEMFGAVTKKGVPGGEDVQPTSATEVGATGFAPEIKISPREVESAQVAGSLPVRAITPSEAKSPDELAKILTQDARVEGSHLPVSSTRRLTALFDRTDGKVHLVSTYAGDGKVRMVDPAIAGKERPNRPIDEILPRYQPISSFLLREPKQNFHQEFQNMGDFYKLFVDEVTAGMREEGTGRFEGIPMSTHETKFQYPKEPQRQAPRPEASELRAFHDFFGDTLPSDRGMFEKRLLKSAAGAHRQMISGLEKLMQIQMRQNRGMSPGEALSNVLDKLYENITKSETRSDFVQRTLDQSRPTSVEGDPETQAAIKRSLAEFDRQKRSGARELTTLRSKAPTSSEPPPPEVIARGKDFEIQRPRQDPKPGAVPLRSPEKLPGEGRYLNPRLVKEHPAPLSPTLYSQLANRQVPEQKYSVTKSRSIQESEPEFPQEFEDDPQIEMFKPRDIEAEPPPEKPKGESLAAEKKAVAKGEGNKGQLDFWKKQGPAMLRRMDEVQEETAKAISTITAYAKRKASEQELAATRDAADSKFAIAGDQADKAIRLASADKLMPNGKPEVLKAAPTVVQAGAYTVDYPVPDALKGDLLTKMEADPIWRNIQGLFSSADPIDKARGGQMLAKLKRETILQMVDDGDIDWRTGTVKYNKRAVDNLDKFGNYLDQAEQKASNILSSKGGGLDGMVERRGARARLKAVEKMREQLDYAKAHWNEPELQDTAAKMVMELEQQHRQERDMGMRVKRSENYLPGRYDEQWFDGDRIHFMEGPKILGKSFRKPATFANYYEAIAAGNYIPFNLDGAALVAHRVRQGMRQVETRLWTQGLKALRDPHSGQPMVASVKRDPQGNAIAPSPEYVTHNIGGQDVAVHKGSLDIIKAITGDSFIQDNPATRRAMQISQKLKHTILFLDTFHLGRLKAYDWSINGIGKGGHKGGLSILEYRPEDVSQAVRKGLVRPEDAAWADEPITVPLAKGSTQVTRRQLGNMFIQRGLNVGRIADAIYKVEGLGWIGKYNHWLFDKMTRGLMLETAVKEFERLSKDNPKTDYRKLIGDISRDTNNYMGSIGRQGWIKNQGFQDLFRMFGLAPQWVEGLIKKETALPARLSGLSYIAGRRDVPLLGTAGRGIARGLATMFVVTQAMNLITRRQPTWKNEEEGHKWDAWIPDVTGKGEGFFMSPLSLFNEVTHDIIRLSGNKPTVYDALHQIGENKLGPYGKAAMVLATGQTPDGRKITSTAGVVKEVGKSLLPVPISLSKVGQAGLAMAGIGQPPAPGSVQRQAMASLGVKTEPAPTAGNQIYRKADQFVKENGLDRSAGWQQVQTDELGYTDLRHAAATGDKKSFDAALEKLRQSRTDEEIYHAMKLWNGRAFTGSKEVEKYFLSDLSDHELELYSRARLERQKTFGNFEDMLIDDLEKSASTK